ncbi:hypothetical protein C8R45DRAFT_928793 [Mycena sanguinolenta]|nr:hypothetical protein C8R45DRAFT_928793 [Mycena sanguinolenta]
MFKLLSLILTSLAMGSILIDAAPQAAPSASCITCPVLFIPVCSAICPAGDDCLIIPSIAAVTETNFQSLSNKFSTRRLYGLIQLAVDPSGFALEILSLILKHVKLSDAVRVMKNEFHFILRAIYRIGRFCATTELRMEQIKLTIAAPVLVEFRSLAFWCQGGIYIEKGAV